METLLAANCFAQSCGCSKKKSSTDGNAYFVVMLGSISIAKRIGPREILDSIGRGMDEVAVVKCHGGDHSKKSIFSYMFFGMDKILGPNK